MIGVFVAHKSNKISGNIRIGRNVFPKKAFAVSSLSSDGLISRRHAAMPTADELIGSAADGTKVFVADRYRLCGDGERNGFLVPSGRGTGSSLLLPAASLMRSSDAVDAGKARYPAWSNSATGKSMVSGSGTSPADSMPVRCVRAK